LRFGEQGMILEPGLEFRRWRRGLPL
jgi:hypothetical protein